MSVVARLEVIPHREGSMSEAVASAVDALDEFDVSYETTPTDTVIEAQDAGEVFAAAEAAHRAVRDDRVITSLEVDDLRTRTQRGRDRVRSVERQLGRRAKRERPGSRGRRRRTGEREERPSPSGRTRVEQTAGGRTGSESPVEGQSDEGRPTSGRPAEERRTGGRRADEPASDRTATEGGEGRETERPPRYGGPRQSPRREGFRADTGSRYLGGQSRGRR